MGRTVRRRFSASAVLIVALATGLLSSGCANRLTAYLRAWAALELVSVEGGTLTVGGTTVHSWPAEYPPHDVTISTFLMSHCEITQGLYEAIMGDNPSYFTSANGYADDPSLPVEIVTWLDAITFCNKLSEYQGLQPIYTVDTSVPGSEKVFYNFSRSGYRLPTEAEWEFAARGGIKSRGYANPASAYLYAGSDIVEDVAWTGSNAQSQTHPVGSKKPNELGLYDMSGNVWECCWDGNRGGFFGDYTDFLGAPPYSAPFINPTGPFTNPVLLDNWFVIRGGSWQDASFGNYPGDVCRVTARLALPNGGASSPPVFDAPFKASDVGFRVVRRP